MYTRPTPKDTEEDILRLQEEFINERANDKVTPAAKLTKEPVSLESCSQAKEDAFATATTAAQFQLENTFESIPSSICVGNVIEKAFVVSFANPQIAFSHNRGFPQAKRRDLDVENAAGSIFAQQMKRFKKEYKLTGPVETNIPDCSYILAETNPAHEEIHHLNAEKLKRMGEHEILEEQKKLLLTLDPAIIAFLKSRRRVDTRDGGPFSVAEQNRAGEEIEVKDIEASREIVAHPDSEKWLNFDIVETGKLAWMCDIKIPKLDKEKGYEARFDFDGWLLPFAEVQIDEKNRSLYHHGEEPGRPGYTLQELFQLSRSTINQQKIIALNTIANILALFQSGVYDGVIEMPIEQIFFVLRFCLDDNVPAVCNASIKAIRSLFYFPIDETCLDNLLGFGLGMVQPIIAVDSKEKDDDNTVNDQQLAETNLIKCLTRTGILERIRYIIQTIRPSTETTIVYCLEILIRMARDSDYIVKQIFNCDSLMESVLKYFAPCFPKLNNSGDPYGCPLQQAIKLTRVLCARSKEITERLMNRYRIVDFIMVYLSNEEFTKNSNGLKLQIETLHLLCIITNYGLSLSMIKCLEPILWRMIDFHIKNTSIHCDNTYVIEGHAAAALNLLAEVARQNYAFVVHNRLDYNSPILKWVAQFNLLQDFTCGKLQIITAFIKHISSLKQNKHTMVNIISQMLRSKGFDVVTSNIRKGSNLLGNFKRNTFSANLRSVEAACWDAPDHIIPAIHTKSCLPFVNVLSQFINNCDDHQLKLSFINHKNVNKYLMQLNTVQNYNLIENWFTRLESQFISNVLRIAVDVHKELDTSMYYEIAIKCLSIFNYDQKCDIYFIFKNIVFSSQFYPCEAFLDNLNINVHDSILRQSLDNLDLIFNIYNKVLDITKEPSTNLSVNSLRGNIIPVDWIYSPIITLYVNKQERSTNTTEEEEEIFYITNCLRWICIYETYFPTLTKLINPTDRYCRIACTFLASDTLFLNGEIHDLLLRCLKNLLKSNETDINFDKPIQGLTNFQDFYTQLLEQYQGVSYGDVLFGNFILLPIMQRHDVKYRKTLWSEYAGIIEIFNVTPEQVLFPINLLLDPPETDLSLLKCYRRAMMKGAIRKHSVLYKIAEHHVQVFLRQRELQ